MSTTHRIKTGLFIALVATACGPGGPTSPDGDGTDDASGSGASSHSSGGAGDSAGGGHTGGGGTGPAGGSSSSGGEPGSGGLAQKPEVLGPQGEWYPFPQNVTYAHGLRSSAIDSDHVRAWYDSWSAKYLSECSGGLRPEASPETTGLVEAQGFAMLAAAYMGDKAVVDQLYTYYQIKLQGCGLMAWKTNCGGVEDSGAATDGDIDVASGLIVAHWQWPEDGYDDKAREIISALKPMILDCGGVSTLYPGCTGAGQRWGGCQETDISYYSPAFFRYFAALSGDAAWTKLADDSHVIRENGENDATGLVPDWQSVSGTAGAGSRKGYYSFDAIRTPFKHGLDYLWNGNESARTWCEKISDWAHGVGVTTLKDEYELNGSPVGSNHNLAVVGSLAVCAMANTQTVLDDFVAESVKMTDDFWYSAFLGNLYLLALSGNMWNPDLVGR